MRKVTWEDENGYLRQAFIKDTDPDDVAKKSGLRHEPPDLSQINWDEVQKDLHNLLVTRNLITWKDVQDQQSSLGPTIATALKRKLIALYRQKV